MNATRELDIILYGATGYTGALVAEQIVATAPAGLRWGVAGRNPDKLAALRDRIGAPADLPLIAVNSEDQASVGAMASRTRQIVTTAGPFQLYGSGVVAACARAGTDYIDLCGEPNWMAEMIPAHHEQARTSGARILFSCGFDSIPFDLGVRFLQEHAIATLGAPLPVVHGRVRAMRGTFSGGTEASAAATATAAMRDPAVLAALVDPFALTPGFRGVDQPRGDTPFEDAATGGWVAPFVMAPINTKAVHRTSFLLGTRYGADFRYDEMVMTGPGEHGRQTAQAIASSKGIDANLKPGDGPSAEDRENGFYDILFVGEAADGTVLRASAKGKRDPGYGATSRMMAQTAFLLGATPRDRLSGGIWTPGAALGLDLLSPLAEHAELVFAIEPGPSSSS